MEREEIFFIAAHFTSNGSIKIIFIFYRNKLLTSSFHFSLEYDVDDDDDKDSVVV
jgi:hypothetical protein